MLASVLCMGSLVCATAAPALADPATGGAEMPTLIAPSTGGTGYGAAGLRSLIVHPIAIVGRDVVARGTMPAGANRRVILQRLDADRGWRNVAGARIRSTDRFVVRWRADRSGPLKLRAVLASRLRRATAAEAAPTADIKVYRPATATYYGPGFFGRQTACGQTLTPDILGVAHKRLPCGTLVAITYADREIVVPVIDRGPFNGSFSWDLTQATADALGFVASGEIGYVRVKS